MPPSEGRCLLPLRTAKSASALSMSRVAGAMAEQAQRDRPVRRMAPAGEGQGAMERDVYAQPWRSGGGSASAFSSSSARKAPAAAIGPIVWDEDGPMPTLKISKTLRNIMTMLADCWGPAGLKATHNRHVATAAARYKTPIHAGDACIALPSPAPIGSHNNLSRRPGVGEDGAMPASEGAETGPSQARWREVSVSPRSCGAWADAGGEPCGASA